MRKISKERCQELRDFWRTGRPIRVLAQRWGMSVSRISQKAKDIGLPPRTAPKLRAWVESGDGYMRAEAARRGMTVETLTVAIVSAVASGKLVTAVLDDERELEREVA